MSHVRSLRKNQSGLTLIEFLVVMFILGIMAIIVLTAAFQDEQPDKTGFVKAVKADHCSKQKNPEACLRRPFDQYALARYCTKATAAHTTNQACVKYGHAWALVFARYGAIEFDTNRGCWEANNYAERRRIEDKWYDDIGHYLSALRERLRAGLKKPIILPGRSDLFTICPANSHLIRNLNTSG